jgi:hypothetical protein
MRQYHHYGIPTEQKRDDESLVEVGGFRFYSPPFEGNKWPIQWHRFPKGHGLPELVTQVPHIAFQVDNLDAEIEGCKSLIEGYEELIDGIKLPDPNDRHVLAAAIKANAQTIVKYNLSDFPSSALSKYEIDAQHPDEFLRHLLDLAPAKVLATVQETRKSLKNPPRAQPNI